MLFKIYSGMGNKTQKHVIFAKQSAKNCHVRMWIRKVAFYLQVLVQVVGVPLLVGPPVAVYDAVVGIPNLRLNDQGKMF